VHGDSKWDGPKGQEGLLLWFAEFRRFGHASVCDVQMGKLFAQQMDCVPNVKDNSPIIIMVIQEL